MDVGSAGDPTQVLGRLTDLPITIRQCAIEGGVGTACGRVVTLPATRIATAGIVPCAVHRLAITVAITVAVTVPEERGECQHRTATHGGFVGGAVEDRVETPEIADRSQCGDRRFTHERLIGVGGERHETVEDRAAGAFVLATGPRRHLDHTEVCVEQGRGQIDAGMHRRDLGSPPAHRRVGIVQCSIEVDIVEFVQPFERSECAGADDRRLVGQSSASSRDVARVTGDRDGPTAIGSRRGHRQDFKRSVSVTTTYAVPNAMTIALTTPITTPSPALATPDTNRRIGFGGL